uniref:GIY-YIG nuclease family protein n=1 Tax=Helicobacter suis TaxID=104628 RepID=UPI0013CF62AE
MYISEVKTAFKIADVECVPSSTKLNFHYLKKLRDENNNPLPQSILTKNVARVYLIVVEGVVKKIGGSQAQGGIKKTLEIYRDGGVNGRPSIRSFGIWYFLYHTILTGKKIEFYMIYQDNFKAFIKGLLGVHEVPEASLSYKFLEEAC